MFLRGQQSSEDTDIRARILNFLEGDTEGACTIDKMVTEVYRVISLKRDAVVVEQNVHAVKSKEQKVKLGEKHNTNEKHNTSENPKRPCWQCGAITS